MFITCKKNIKPVRFIIPFTYNLTSLTGFTSILYNKYYIMSNPSIGKNLSNLYNP